MRYRKYNGAAHRDYPARRLGDDAHGTWLGVDAGTPSIYHGRPSVEQIPFVAASPARVLVDSDVQPANLGPARSTATSPALPSGTETNSSIWSTSIWTWSGDGTPAGWSCSTRTSSRHTRSSSVIPEVVEPARAAATWLKGVLGDGTEPFASGYRAFLAQVSGVVT